MLTESRSALHFGVNFIIAPPPLVDGRMIRRFQDAMADQGIEFDVVNAATPGLGVFQRSQRRLEVRVLLAQGAPVGQLLALAPQPARTLDEFIAEAEDVCEAFTKTWPGPRQVVARDCSVQHLYDVTADHAFQYLWEQRLHEDSGELTRLGRPVLGGGLRLVMPPKPDESEPRQVEVKIESFLQDSKKLFVQVDFAWPAPKPPGDSFDPKAMLEEVESYATKEVLSFISGEKP